MKTMLRLSAIALVIAMTGCASYRPYSTWNDGGFWEQEVQTNHFQVRFVGNEHTTLSTVEDLAMLRAAELCMQREMPFVELSSVQSDRLPLGLSPRYYGSMIHGVNPSNLQYLLPWAVKTTYMETPDYDRKKRASGDIWRYAPITDLTATCVPESREGVADAAELAKQMRTLHANRVD